MKVYILTGVSLILFFIMGTVEARPIMDIYCADKAIIIKKNMEIINGQAIIKKVKVKLSINMAIFEYTKNKLNVYFLTNEGWVEFEPELSTQSIDIKDYKNCNKGKFKYTWEYLNSEDFKDLYPNYEFNYYINNDLKF